MSKNGKITLIKTQKYLDGYLVSFAVLSGSIEANRCRKSCYQIKKMEDSLK